MVTNKRLKNAINSVRVFLNQNKFLIIYTLLSSMPFIAVYILDIVKDPRYFIKLCSVSSNTLYYGAYITLFIAPFLSDTIITYLMNLLCLWIISKPIFNRTKDIILLIVYFYISITSFIFTCWVFKHSNPNLPVLCYGISCIIFGFCGFQLTRQYYDRKFIRSFGKIIENQFHPNTIFRVCMFVLYLFYLANTDWKQLVSGIFSILLGSISYVYFQNQYYDQTNMYPIITSKKKLEWIIGMEVGYWTIPIVLWVFYVNSL